MILKDIFNSTPQLENELNKIIYAYLSKGIAVPLPADAESFVKNGYAGDINIYPIIRKIANPASGVRWFVHDENGEIIEDSELMLLLRQPNPKQSLNEFVDESICWRLTTGNSFIWVLSPETGANKGKPAEIWNMPASQTQIVSGGYFEPVKEYNLIIGDTSKKIPATEVIHSKYTNLQYDSFGSQLYGMSPLEAALKVMAASRAGYIGLAKQYENGGPDVIITGTKETAQQEYTDEQRLTVWQSFKERFSGARNKGKWLIKNLPVEVHEIGKSPIDMGTLEFMKLTKTDYCNVYNVPPVLMSTDASTYNNQSTAVKQLWNDAIIPELERTKDIFDNVGKRYRTATGKMEFINYDVSDIPELQADNSTMSQALSTAWWLTPNQRLAMMGLPPDETNPLMNTVFAPMGLIPLSDMADQPTPEEAQKMLHGLKY